MDASIIVAIVTGLATILSVVVTTRASAKETDAKIEKQQAVFEAIVTERISTLQQKVERHNSVIERTYKLEEATALQDAELKRINKRLEKVEQKEN